MAEIINDNDLGQVSGGWQYANGSFVNYGNYIVYTVAPGDVLSGIGQRFGVSYMQIAQWNQDSDRPEAHHLSGSHPLIRKTTETGLKRPVFFFLRTCGGAADMI